MRLGALAGLCAMVVASAWVLPLPVGPGAFANAAVSDDRAGRPGIEDARRGGRLAQRYAQLVRRLGEAFEAEDFERGLRFAERAVEMKPFDPIAHYNLACGLAMTGDVPAAEAALEEAIELGFVDFHHIERNRYLEPIRGGETYRRVFARWPELLDARAAAEERAFREAFDERAYSCTEDVELRLQKVSAYDEAESEVAWSQLRRVAAWAESEFPAWFGAEAGRPPAWVMVALPTAEDFAVLTGFTAGVGGVYDKHKQRLVSRDIGSSLRHEFVHVLHWRHMDRIGQVHPMWVQEGLAGLVEDVAGGIESAVLGDAAGGLAAGSAGGELRPLPNWRTNIVKRRVERGLLTPWTHLFAMDKRRFMARHRSAHYAESRAVMMFLHERGKLGAWYERFVTDFDEDPTGLGAVSIVFDQPIAEVERAFRRWAAELPKVSEVMSLSGGGLGVPLEPGEGDGPVVAGLGGPKGVEGVGDDPENRVRLRDVILAIDGVRTPTLDELLRVLGEYEAGEVVEVSLRRGSLRRTVRVELLDAEAGQGLEDRWP